MDQIQAGMSLNEDWNELEMEGVGRPGGDWEDWEDWKNTGGFTRKTWMDKVDTWITHMDYMDNPPY